MYYGRKKGINLIILIIIILIIIIGGGIAVYLFTDLFKANDKLFIKYFAENAQMIEYTKSSEIKEISNLKKETPYKITGNISVDCEGNRNAQALKQLQLNINSYVNKPEEKSYSKANVKYQNENIFSLEYANTQNIYALKSDEIVTAFVGIRNDNLKVLAQKLGISDTINIPNSIPQIDLEEILSITESNKQHIIETYLPVISNSINKQNYSKQSNVPITREGVQYNTTTYRVDLNSEETAIVLINILNTLKQDSIMLNEIATKAKILKLSDDYTQINKLTQKIQEQIEVLQNSTKSPEKGISIVLYVDKGKVILTEIILKNELKIEMYGTKQENQNTINIILNNLSSNDNFNEIEILLNIIQDASKARMQLFINQDNKKSIQLNIDKNLSSTGDGEINNYEITIETENNEIYTINYNEEVVFEELENEIISLDYTNCAILNDYPSDQLSMLISLVTQQVQNVINQKAQIVGWNID